jgi:hypothetical protein
MKSPRISQSSRTSILYKGFFPDSAKGEERQVYRFVHLDFDIYESTLKALKFFYSRMVRGGLLERFQII